MRLTSVLVDAAKLWHILDPFLFVTSQIYRDVQLGPVRSEGKLAFGTSAFTLIFFMCSINIIIIYLCIYRLILNL